MVYNQPTTQCCHLKNSSGVVLRVFYILKILLIVRQASVALDKLSVSDKTVGTAKKVRCTVNNRLVAIGILYFERGGRGVSTFSTASNFGALKKIRLSVPAWTKNELVKNSWKSYSIIKGEFFREICSGLLPKYTPIISRYLKKCILFPVVQD